MTNWAEDYKAEHTAPPFRSHTLALTMLASAAFVVGVAALMISAVRLLFGGIP